jgi:quercetin dioxygenase-like cupin family protein
LLSKEVLLSKRPIITKDGHAEELTATGAQIRFLCPAAATQNAWSLIEVSLPRDAGPPLHHHDWDEGYYVVEGEVNFTVGDEKLLAKSGDFLYAPGGVNHAFQGASDKPSRVLVFDAPAAAEAFFRDVDREIKNWPQEAYKMGEIGARHKIHFFPPKR